MAVKVIVHSGRCILGKQRFIVNQLKLIQTSDNLNRFHKTFITMQKRKKILDFSNGEKMLVICLENNCV